MHAKYAFIEPCLVSALNVTWSLSYRRSALRPLRCQWIDGMLPAKEYHQKEVKTSENAEGQAHAA